MQPAPLGVEEAPGERGGHRHPSAANAVAELFYGPPREPGSLRRPQLGVEDVVGDVAAIDREHLPRHVLIAGVARGARKLS